MNHLEFVMDQLIAMNAEITMSSREIAALVEKRHDNVKRTIETLADRGVIQLPQIEEVKNHLGQSVSEYNIGKRDSYVIVAQLSPEFTARLVDRWQELEAQRPSLPNFNDPVAAARAWADAVELKIKAEEKLAIAAPKAAIVDRVMERTNLLNATQVAQQVGMSAVAMNRHLDKIGCVYSKSVKRGRVFQQGWLEFGFGEMKQTVQGYPQALFTTSGAIRVVELLTSEGVI